MLTERLIRRAARVERSARFFATLALRAHHADHPREARRLVLVTEWKAGVAQTLRDTAAVN